MAGRAGTIEVVATPKAHFVNICVNDSGPGIPSHLLPSMFDAFTTSKPDGMGIGLKICREIVEAHGGRITARNIAEGGASICFTMPLAQA
jgi:signal transduction histidine kinase